ncbi:exodeoxyribonuclease 7 large subunit [Amylibacter marinus]|uniref:Exodeoxyribonuclease 7 large subunit n=1 Tax=Amylibacter marinus TaxID=1475483 RepID=A0ABQ5VU01_9RHOB|nr:exodeoxyribonuclease VII large subunit [Amylibacter marinus]GLQ34588.1 exodeoxyribonuclease 7 large subunit [Amylibacter marinus]
MSDLIDSPAQGQNAPEFSVSEISRVIKRVIEGEFSHVRIKGEVGRVVRARSGHLYFDIKDDNAVINSICWKGQAAKLATQPEEGLEVVATGKITTYPGQSRYQMVVSELAVAGVGALMAQLEKRKAALSAEGLFDPDRKKPIPYLPGIIGVVTSPSGAVIRDILHRLRDRFPRKVLVWPVAVQGANCAPEVTRAIQGFNALTPGGALPRPELIIVARGGGSIEDLWGFNEEMVVRAAADSDIPLISAVGHETDTTLIDYASDRRAPTPTAAAEMAVPVWRDLTGHVAQLEQRRLGAITAAIDTRRQRLRDLSRALPKPADILAQQGQRLDMVSARLPRALQMAATGKGRQLAQTAAALRPQILRTKLTQNADTLGRLGKSFIQTAENGLERRSQSLAGLERVLNTLGYEATLMRGYAVVRDETGRVVTRANDAQSQRVLEIQFQDGKVKTTG